MPSLQDYVEFANKCGQCFIATMDGNQPRVRPMSIVFADKRGFYFQTETPKAFYCQIKANRNIEVCFYGTDRRVMRLTGEIEFVDDMEIKSQVFKDRPFLKGLGIEKPDNPMLVIFRIAKGEAFFWTMQNNMKESEIERFKFNITP